MATQIETYFKSIASLAEQAVRDSDRPPGALPPVVDAPQLSRSTAWTGVAIHPMSVLESEYVSIVLSAEAKAGSDQDLARENGFAALSRFFSLSSGIVPLLQSDAAPLIEERTTDLAAQLDLVRTMQAEQIDGVGEELALLVADAAELVSQMISADQLQYAAAGIKAAASYLGMFALSAPQAADRWSQSHADPTRLSEYLDDVSSNLIAPLVAPANAAASSRSLFNIEPFYLYRLMHRFVGGEQGAPMDLVAKGVASGAATGAMHRADWEWLTEWHEKRVVELKKILLELDQQLMAEFKRTGDDNVIRFHLKGGRAMNTALKTPSMGTNDWDTGILINPGLSPENWYDAFARVNDAVVRFLDRARFDYTALLNAHAADLNSPQPAAHKEADFDPDQPAFTSLALQSEHQEESLPCRSSRSPVRQARGLASTTAKAKVTAVGVNGELIDVGISRRSSVELAEHWQDVTIVDMPGATVPGIPVPTLPYYVDDFSSIIRGAISDETADRKLAKRLRRLLRVLESDDESLLQAATEANRAVVTQLPQGAEAFGSGVGGSEQRLKAWVLAALLQSLPQHATWVGWTKALDAKLSQQAKALLDSAQTAALWQEIEGAIARPDRDACHSLLIVEKAASTLAHDVLADARLIARSVGGPNSTQSPWWKSLEVVISSVMELNPKPNTSRGFGQFYLTGWLAALLQTQHAGLKTNKPMDMCSDGPVELFYRAEGGMGVQRPLEQLVNRFQMVLRPLALQAQLVGSGADAAIMVMTQNKFADLAIPLATPTILVVRAEQTGAESSCILDYLHGWPTASTRDLTRLFAERAAHTHDYDLRESRKSISNFLRTEVLGRQLR